MCWYKGLNWTETETETEKVLKLCKLALCSKVGKKWIVGHRAQEKKLGLQESTETLRKP